MASSKPQAWWETIRRARLLRLLAIYLGASFVVIQLVDIFTAQLGLPDWLFPDATALLLIGLPIVVTTALVQTGKVRGIRFNTLNAICRTLDCKPGDILDYEPDAGDAGATER
jgi:hypothetical protein